MRITSPTGTRVILEVTTRTVTEVIEVIGNRPPGRFAPIKVNVGAGLPLEAAD
jgi:hypothetical protein